MKVTVTRGPGDRPMQDITEAILSGSEAAMRARANAELDAAWPPARTAEIEIAPRSDIRPGMIVEIVESGQPKRHALVRRVNISESRSGTGALQRSMTITVEYREERE